MSDMERTGNTASEGHLSTQGIYASESSLISTPNELEHLNIRLTKLIDRVSELNNKLNDRLTYLKGPIATPPPDDTPECPSGMVSQLHWQTDLLERTLADLESSFTGLNTF